MLAQLIQDVRSFNRFYTVFIGLLDKHHLNSPFSLPEARVLYELNNHAPCTASDLQETMQIDKGYLSRILLQFRKQKLVQRSKSERDGRQMDLALTPAGKKAAKELSDAANRQLRDLLKPLTAPQQAALMEHLRGTKDLLEKLQHNQK